MAMYWNDEMKLYQNTKLILLLTKILVSFDSLPLVDVSAVGFVVLSSAMIDGPITCWVVKIFRFFGSYSFSTPTTMLFCSVLPFSSTFTKRNSDLSGVYCASCKKLTDEG